MPFSERRRHPRIPVKGDVRVRVFSIHRKGLGSEIDCEGTTRDVSELGIGLTLPMQVAPGDIVKLRIALPDPPAVFLHHAVVRWTASVGNGYWRCGMELQGSEEFLAEWRAAVRALAKPA